MINMNKLKIGIIGCGTIAETHAWAIEENDTAVLTALCDINPERLEKMDSKRNCMLFNDWHQMLLSDHVDAVAICLPHNLHEPAVIDALRADKHVICEKPLAVSGDQLNKMKKTAADAEKRGILSFGILQHRFSPLIQEVRKVIMEKALGELLRGDISFFCTRDCNYYSSDSWRGQWLEEGGGTLINQGIHTLDILQYLIGNPEGVEYQLSRKKLKCIEVEDKGTGALLYPSSVIKSEKISLHFENDLITDWKPEIKLTGSLGTLTLRGSEDFSCTIPSIADRLHLYIMGEVLSAPGKKCYGSLHSENYEDIISSIENKHKPQVSLNSLADTTETVLALYQSHFQNKKIVLPLDSWVEPYKLKYTGEHDG